VRIELGEFCIRSFAVADAESIVKYANDRRVSLNLRDRFPFPYTRAHAAEFLDAALSQRPETDFAIATRQEVIGGIGYHRQADVYRLSAELGYWLGQPFWGRGIATAAVRALTERIFATTPLVRLYAHVFAWNTASARVLEKAGYQLEGRMRSSVIKDGQLIDQLMFAIVRERPDVR
jgi:RimJ/RimL family protein N-acetyltransferase